MSTLNPFELKDGLDQMMKVFKKAYLKSRSIIDAEEVEPTG